MVMLAVLAFAGAGSALGQNGQEAGPNTGGIRGQVADPTGAVIPGAIVVVRTTSGKVAGKTASDAGGVYAVKGLDPGTYSVTVTAPGFAAYSVPGIEVAAGQMKNLNPRLQIQMAQQEVQVQAENTTQISTSPESNANSVIIKGSDLNSLSDDPDELQNELQALAGPSAGPNGGQVYIDGFTGGQLPPKSSIREIRVNQNPFSAEYDRLGYGRIEIFTKPGTDKLHGEAQIAGNDSPFNAKNPILGPSSPQPPYYSYFMHGFIGGPINKSSSYFVGVFARNQQNQSISEAINPASITTLLANNQTNGVPINAAIGNPTSRLDVSPRVDIQLGQANTLTVRWEYNRLVDTNGGLGTYSLPLQAINANDQENALQISDSLVLSKNLVDDIRFQYRRIRDQQTPVSALPSFSVQQTFTDGGANSQVTADHENDFELQDYLTGSYGRHSLNFGTRIRMYQDTNYTTGGSNGLYIFNDTKDFLTCYQSAFTTNAAPSSCSPQQYTYTKINNGVARVTPWDGALFYQDDWKVNQRFTFSYGLRWETQNWISDHSDWAPRFAFAYALGNSSGHQPAKTVIRAGYGWFYQRFTVANGFGTQTPYVATVVHQNGINEQTFIQNRTSTQSIPFYQYVVHPISGTSAGSATGGNAPTIYTVDPHFKTANDMEAAIGVDRQLSKFMTGNVTYIFSQGIHQYFTDNVNAAALFPLADALNGVYPSQPVPEPLTNNLQYQAGGFYKEHQVMVTARANYRSFSFFTNYTWTHAMGDTSGVGSVPSVSSFPGLDYGRTAFDIAHRFMVFGNFMLPWKVSVSPMMMVHSGRPFDITTGSDLTSNNQFNGRPTYAPESDCAVGVSTVRSTPYGCLNLKPFGSGQKIIPYGVGTGPVNISMNMRLSKVIGVGPKLGAGQHGASGGGFHGGPRGLGGGGLSGNRGGPGRLDQAVSRKYSLTFSLWGTNILNHENLGTPNGVLNSPFFNTSQSLVGGFFGSHTPGNRSIFLQTMFNF